eukprot:TRINITY_DN21_c0_g1_i2.p1 TRINITY_DN21_c0_g1~~TRINITY_DN21_c0_g1_i2.p1  ORF type:complete len:196 (+),score=81.92 TRINITY_DN21_c0_g1_i2:85-672(+)
MLVPKKNRLAVYSALFRDGVICAKKDVFAPKHHELEVPNLHVIKLLQSLKSQGLVTELFNWNWYYWALKNEGIEFLRSYLHLPAEIVPATLKKSSKPLTRSTPRFEEGGRGRGRGRGRGGRDEYRKRADGAPRGFNPEFQEGEAAPAAAEGEAQPEGGFRGRGGRGGRGGFRGRGGRGGFRGGRGGFGRPAESQE